MTLSVFRARKNRKTFSDLEARGILSPTDVPGIYRVSQITDLPLQIVITDELQGDEYTAYRAFSDRAKQDDIMHLIAIGNNTEDDILHRRYQTIVKLIGAKNPEAFEEIGGDRTMKDFVREFFKDEFREQEEQFQVEKEQFQLREKEYQQQIQQQKEQYQQQIQQQAMMTTAENIKTIMKNTKSTLKQAMDTLSIPAKDRKKLKELVET